MEVAVENKVITEAPPESKPYQPFGSNLEFMYAHDDEVIIGGPAGTGKTRGALEKLHLCATKYPGMRGLMIRKTRESLTQSGMVTYERLVIPNDGSVIWRTAEQEYRYSNGSTVVVGGMDKYTKVMSTEYDLIVVLESTELLEEDWEALTTRARFGVMPYNQVIGDCNPGPPTHWIKQREAIRKLRLIPSYLEDNPTLYDHRLRKWTPRGTAYIAKLDNLTGVRYLRLRKGLWVAAEGAIYPEFQQSTHMVMPFFVPYSWQRIWVVDFGFVNPFVWQCWAVSPEGVMYRIAEIYKTKLLVEDAAAIINNWRLANKEPLPAAIVCDWNAEDRATLERHLHMGTTPADKAVSAGIQSMKVRLRDKTMLFFRDALLEVDFDLQDARQPTKTEDEIEGYEWNDAKKKDEPKKINDHGMDTSRYGSMYVDNSLGGWVRGARG